MLYFEETNSVYFEETNSVYFEETNSVYFDNLSKFPQIKHFIGTRQDGNVSFSASNNHKNVIRNRTKIASMLSIKLEDFVVAGLTHGDHVQVVTREMKGRGSDNPKDTTANTDALITNVPGLFLMVPVADCVPILFFDPKNLAIGITHAGWRGTLKKITKKTVNSMKQNFNTNPKDLIVGIGPCVCVKHYEVDEAVLPKAKGHFDLRLANKLQLLNVGVKEKNIEIMPYCTYERVDLFYSHRSEGKTGRFATGILITG